MRVFFHSSDSVALVYRESLFEVGMAQSASSWDSETPGSASGIVVANFVISLACNGRKVIEGVHALTGLDRRDLMTVVAPTTDAVPLEKAVSSYFLDETEAGPRPALFAHLMSHPEISTRGVIAVMGFLVVMQLVLAMHHFPFPSGVEFRY